jgi:uncharacterized membrane protein (UPF0127 family)
LRHKEVTIYNLSQPHSKAVQARYCNTFLCRLRGLTFRRNLEPDTGLLLVQKKENRLDAAIHMLFMWIDLAVVWIDSGMQVVDVQEARRWRLMYLPQRPAQYVLELSVYRQVDFAVGDHLRFEKASSD